MKTILTLALVASCAIIPLTTAQQLGVPDPVGDEAAVVPIVGITMPRDVIDCEDENVDILHYHVDSFPGHSAGWLFIKDFAGARECVETGLELEDRYEFAIAPVGAAVETEPGVRFVATRDPSGWSFCTRIEFADGSSSGCHGFAGFYGGGLHWSVPADSAAPYGEGTRAYTLNAAAYDATVFARATGAKLVVEDRAEPGRVVFG